MTSPRTGVPLAAFASAIAVAAGAGFLAGRFLGGGGDTPASSAPSEPLDPLAGDAEAPLSGIELDPAFFDAGSLFRSRFAAAAPEEGVEAVLLTPGTKAGVCLDHCPMSLRVEDGAAGAKSLVAVLASLERPVTTLAEAAAGQPQFADALRRAYGALAERAAAGAGPAQGVRPVRALFSHLPRTDVERGLHSVGLAVYDHEDPYFDEGAAPPAAQAAGAPSGWRLSIARLERRQPGRAKADLVAGDVAVFLVVHDTAGAPGAADATPGPEAEALALARGPTGGHFEGLGGSQFGLLLQPDGTVLAYGPGAARKPLPLDRRLRRALAALLKRA